MQNLKVNCPWGSEIKFISKRRSGTSRSKLSRKQALLHWNRYFYTRSWFWNEISEQNFHSSD